MGVTLTRESERPHVARLTLDVGELNLFTIAEARELRETLESVPEEVAVLTVGADRSADVPARSGASRRG